MKKNKNIIISGVVGAATLCGALVVVAPAAVNAAPLQYNNATGSCSSADVVVPKLKSSKLPGFENNAKVKSLVADQSITWENTVNCAKKKPKKAATQYTTNWSGYVASNNQQTSINYAQTQYREPSVSSVAHTDVAVWAGIGGAIGTKGTLIQAGTDIETINNKQIHSPWFEVVPNEYMNQITNMPIAVGDSIFTSSGWSKGTASFVICNLTKKVCANVTEQNIASPGNSAEWIVEKVANPAASNQLGNYKQVTFTNNNWLKNSSGSIVHGIAGWSTNNTMVGTSGKVISAPTPISGQVFSTNWKAAN